MSRSSRPDRLRLFAIAAALAAALIGISCSKTGPPTKAEHTYTVRGRIVALPDPAQPGSSLQIQHEAVPDFVGARGDIGMASMTMHFRPAQGLSLGGLAPGDAVEFTWAVSWKPTPDSRVTAIHALPRDTELHFGPVK